MEWINLWDRYPDNEQKVKIRIKDKHEDKFWELEAVYSEDKEF